MFCQTSNGKTVSILQFLNFDIFFKVREDILPESSNWAHLDEQQIIRELLFY